MRTISKVLGIALAVLIAGSGLAVAAGGFGPGPAASDGDRTPIGQGDGVGPVADADRPFDGHNSPWATGDEDRLEQFQERFALTDAQVEEIRAEVTSMIDDGATREEIRAQVVTMLEGYGVADPTLGPVDGQRLGTGPHGPADGSCLN